jgi:hypothetical protein
MIIHALANADYTNYQYSEVYIPGGETVTLGGETVAVPTGSGITLPIGVNNTGSGVGGATGTLFLIGKKKPEAFRNTDGTYPIR